MRSMKASAVHALFTCAFFASVRPEAGNRPPHHLDIRALEAVRATGTRPSDDEMDAEMEPEKPPDQSRLASSAWR